MYFYDLVFLAHFGVVFGCFSEGVDMAEVCYIVVGLHIHRFLKIVTFRVTFGSTFGSILAPRIFTIVSKGVSEADFRQL